MRDKNVHIYEFVDQFIGPKITQIKEKAVNGKRKDNAKIKEKNDKIARKVSKTSFSVLAENIQLTFAVFSYSSIDV